MDKTVEELRNLGNKKFRELNYGAALMYYTQGIDKDPNSYALYYNRAVTFVKMDNIEEAKEDLNKSLSIKPDYIPSLCQLGFVYLYQGNTPDSLESYVKVVKINETLPHQLNRFKAQLKEAIRLAESRCRQQEYSDSFIDAIITREIRDILDGYPNLPTHMVESGIPSVSFGNVPISHHAGSLGPSATVIASGAIPITLRRNRNNAADIANTTTTDNNATNTANITDITNPNNINDIISHIPGLNNFLNPAGGAIAASISVQELPNNNNGSNASDNNNETNTEVAAENINGNTPEPRHTPVIVNPISSNFNNRNDNVRTPALDFISLHRAAHESAVSRAAELRRQREQERRDREERQRNSTNEFTTAATAAPSPPSPPTAPSPASSVNPTITSPTSTTVNTAPGVDFARHIASMVASQFGGGASSSGEPASLAQNLTTIASGVLGGLANVNNAHNANSSSSTTTSTDANSTNISTNFNNTNTTNTNHNNDLEDLDMDLD